MALVLRNLILVASDDKSFIFTFLLRETNRFTGNLKRNSILSSLFTASFVKRKSPHLPGSFFFPFARHETFIITIMHNKRNQVVSISKFLEFSGSGDNWGIPPEVPLNDEVRQACARVTNLHLVWKQGFRDSCGAKEKDWKGGG